ncbi:DUF3857 domain-containing protein [Chitinophaga sp. 30R24]|uniref:DUF3857 domain-containing protein n=1 Tax=Chitinophaga sp. 30R24 TaxID=3248838 RepID=UPI003B9156D2
MKKWTLVLTVAMIATWPTYVQAQVTSSFPDIWKDKPVPHTGITTDHPFSLLDFRILRDFNTSPRDKGENFTQYKTVYKHIQVNTQMGADSLSQFIIEVAANEVLRGLRIRLLHPNGQLIGLNQQVRMMMQPDHRKQLVINDLKLEPGSELEYELSVKTSGSFAGNDYLQSATPTNQAAFTLIAPEIMTFRFKTSAGLPSVTDSIANGNHYYQMMVSNIPALPTNELYFYQPQLQRIDFALQQVAERKDTVRINWQQFGEDSYIPLVAVSKAEYKQLEKEIHKWPFLQQRLPVPTLIYLVEQYIKTNIAIIPASGDGETMDIISILHNKRAEKAGLTRLMNAVYYILNIPTQVLFTSSRDQLPLDSQLVNGDLPTNVLLYFPALQQALSPTEMNTRFPCYPALWAGIPALRCRDTLIGQESKVFTDFIQTPVVSYTFSNVALEATLADITNPVWEVKQTFSGYPAANVKTAFTNDDGTTESKFKIYNAILPFESGERKPTAIAPENETFTNRPLDKPVQVNSTLLTSSVIENNGNQYIIHIGHLLGGTISAAVKVPENAALPVQIVFPYYQEKRISITLPAGYKVTNKSLFSANISDKGAQPALGYKMRCEQEGNQLHIFVVEWYRQTNFYGAQKMLFQQMMDLIQKIQSQNLVLEK